MAPRKRPPARTKEARENQLIDLATRVAEKQLEEGTASAQVITHYLKLATVKEDLEREKLREENKLLKARTEAIESTARQEALYAEVLSAIKSYNGAPMKDDLDD